MSNTVQAAADDDASEIFEAVIPPELAGARLDKALAQLCDGLSRTRIQNLMDEGCVTLNGKQAKTASFKVEEGQSITVELPEVVEADPVPENIPLDILFEDDDVIVINKAAGMVVHPAVGHGSGTLVNALLYHCGATLSGINGVRRPGIVHRLDKETSGVMIAAKNDFAHASLAAQLADRTLSRIYTAIVLGTPVPKTGFVDAPVGRHHANRLKMAVTKTGREARTNYVVAQARGENFSLLTCALETGRTHQIRVHMNHIGFPLIGDPLYGPQPTAVSGALRRAGVDDEDDKRIVTTFPRQALHATVLEFEHPQTGDAMSFEAGMPDDMAGLKKILFKSNG